MALASMPQRSAAPPPIHSGEGRAMVQFLDPQFGRPAVKLLPADYYAGRGEVAVVTVLGSCVAACLSDPVARVGGMNHFMLPEGGGGGEDARYGGYLMEVLINALLKLGARRERIEAKVFGGGNVLQGFTANPVGTRNADFVLAYLGAERIPVVAEDLRGIHPRKLCYFPDSGAAKVKRLPHAHDAELVQQERNYRTHLTERAPAAGSVELFD